MQIQDWGARISQAWTGHKSAILKTARLGHDSMHPFGRLQSKAVAHAQPRYSMLLLTRHGIENPAPHCSHKHTAL